MPVSYKELGQQVEALLQKLTPAFLESNVQTLLRAGEEVGGGVNASRLVKHLLGKPNMQDIQTNWAYQRLKPTFRAAFDQIPSLYYFEGD
jgi:hypothetical protein